MHRVLNHTRRAPRPVLLAGFALLAVHAGAAAQDADTRLQKDVGVIAAGDPVDAMDAARRLTRELNRPLKAALDGLHTRRGLEQIRVLLAVEAALAEARAAALRSTLPDEDRKLFDAFAEASPEVVRQLFDTNPENRRQALDQIPREPGTGASVLLAAAAWDDDIDNAAAALKLAAGRQDAVLHRNLRRYAAMVLELLESDLLGGGREAYDLLLGQHLLLACQALASGGDAEGLPLIERVLTRYAGPPLHEYLDCATVYRALGSGIGTGAAPLLIKQFHDAKAERTLSLGPGRILVQTGADVALAAVLNVYGLAPKDVGMTLSENVPGEPGFLSDVERKQAQKQFTRWYAENAEKPEGERKPIAAYAEKREASQP